MRTPPSCAGDASPYGEGITFWPVVELVGQAAGLSILDASRGSAAEAALRHRSGRALGTVSPTSWRASWASRRRTHRSRSRSGRSGGSSRSSRPIDRSLLLLDDLQWAEPTFLDLVEHVAEWSRDAPILILAQARPELRDDRPGWGGAVANATSILLEPLTEAETAQLSPT